jgi:hypothetical protein
LELSALLVLHAPPEQICKELLLAKALQRAAQSHLRAQKRTVQKQSRYR